jgi:hypothetical protein
MALSALTYLLISSLAPLDLAGHMVSIAMVFSSAEQAPSASRLGKTVMKKHRNAKFDYIDIVELDQSAFIREWLRVHDLADQYSPGVHNGPPFKMWWTGSRYVYKT